MEREIQGLHNKEEIIMTMKELHEELLTIRDLLIEATSTAELLS